jgi:hypothetical protein
VDFTLGKGCPVLFSEGSFMKNVSNSMKDVIYLPDGSSNGSEWVDEHNIYVGNEIKFNSWSLMLGMKGYYSLNSIGQKATNAGHYHGFGIMTGVKF